MSAFFSCVDAVTGGPLEYGAAEAVARAYIERYPDRRSWVSVPAPLSGRGRPPAGDR